MDRIISQLFGARDIAHLLHLSTRSFAAHLALGELYEALTKIIDALAEMHMGKYGNLDVNSPIFTFTRENPKAFIAELANFAENEKNNITPDGHVRNEWDSLLAIIYKVKYKLDRLM